MGLLREGPETASDIDSHSSLLTNKRLDSLFRTAEEAWLNANLELTNASISQARLCIAALMSIWKYYSSISRLGYDANGRIDAYILRTNKMINDATKKYYGSSRYGEDFFTLREEILNRLYVIDCTLIYLWQQNNYFFSMRGTRSTLVDELISEMEQKSGGKDEDVLEAEDDGQNDQQDETEKEQVGGERQ